MGISIPYVSWKSKRIPKDPLKLFDKFFNNISEDIRNASIKNGSFPFCVSEIDIDWFKKEHKYQYNLINDTLEKLKISLKNNNSVTPKRLTKAFNELIHIPNLIQLLNENKGIPGVWSEVPDRDTIVTNKQKMLEIYPHTLAMVLNNNTDIKIYLHDSRKMNKKISNSSIDFVFTSPPYLNNFDYGEALKVYLLSAIEN